jgi:3-vinyl bacteriochlorophyllide hydratase
MQGQRPHAQAQSQAQRRAQRAASFGEPTRAVSPPGAVLTRWLDAVAPCPWPAHVGSHTDAHARREAGKAALYSVDERARRDRSPWTTVQAILAPLQFLAFAASLVLVLRFLMTGEGYALAVMSVLVKCGFLYVIMVTGAVWEKEVFGQYLFARAFFWEDVFSMLVIALHTAYVWALLAGWGTPQSQMAIAIAAYAAYVINAAQFLLKLREARLEAVRTPLAMAPRQTA